MSLISRSTALHTNFSQNALLHTTLIYRLEQIAFLRRAVVGIRPTKFNSMFASVNLPADPLSRVSTAHMSVTAGCTTPAN